MSAGIYCDICGERRPYFDLYPLLVLDLAIYEAIKDRVPYGKPPKQMHVCHGDKCLGAAIAALIEKAKENDTILPK